MLSRAAAPAPAPAVDMSYYRGDISYGRLAALIIVGTGFDDIMTICCWADLLVGYRAMSIRFGLILFTGEIRIVFICGLSHVSVSSAGTLSFLRFSCDFFNGSFLFSNAIKFFDFFPSRFTFVELSPV